MSAKNLDNVSVHATSIAMKNLVALIFLAGCASSTEAADDDVSGIEQQDLTAKTSFYRVPVSDPALAALANYPISVKTQRVDGTIRVHYDMPVALVGAANVAVDLVGTDTGTIIKVAGAAGLGKCIASEASLICNERLPGVRVDLVGVRRQAVLDGLSPTEVDMRVEIARRFIIDPIGIMRAQFAAAAGGGGGGRNGGGGRDR
jgi:hypothetical protein